MPLKGRNLRQKVIGKVWINYQGTLLQLGYTTGVIYQEGQKDI